MHEETTRTDGAGPGAEPDPASDLYWPIEVEDDQMAARADEFSLVGLLLLHRQQEPRPSQTLAGPLRRHTRHRQDAQGVGDVQLANARHLSPPPPRPCGACAHR